MKGNGEEDLLLSSFSLCHSLNSHLFYLSEYMLVHYWHIVQVHFLCAYFCGHFICTLFMYIYCVHCASTFVVYIFYVHVICTFVLCACSHASYNVEIECTFQVANLTYVYITHVIYKYVRIATSNVHSMYTYVVLSFILDAIFGLPTQ